MTTSSTLNQSTRQKSQRPSSRRSNDRLSGELIVAAALVGVSRSFANQRRGLLRQASRSAPGMGARGARMADEVGAART